MNPKINPDIVDITTTKVIYTKVFCVPITLRITSILGSDSAGPASSSASAGPLPIPLLINPCKIGTSVKVAKYINAPTIEAKKFEKIELPPTKSIIHSFGIIPFSLPGAVCPKGYGSKKRKGRLHCAKLTYRYRLR